MAMFTMTLGDS